MEMLREQRARLNLTQELFAQKVTDAGYVISRSTLANMETGASMPSHAAVTAFDHALDLRGRLVTCFEEELPDGQFREARKAREMQDDLDSDELADLTPDERIRDLCESFRGDQLIRVLRGPTLVRRAIAALLHVAGNERRNDRAGTIELAHISLLPGRFHDGLAADQRLIRERVTHLIRQQWPVRLVASVPDSGEAGLVRALCPFIASPSFDVRLNRSTDTAREGRLVIPGIALAQLFDPDEHGQYESILVITHKDAVALFPDIADETFQRAEPFIRRHQRPDRSDIGREDIAAADVAFREELLSSSRIEGQCGQSLGILPSNTCPPTVYAQRVRRRMASSHTPDAPAWQRMIDLQQERHDLLIQQLEQRLIDVRFLLSPDMVASSWTDDDDHPDLWRLATASELEQHLDHVHQLADRYPDNFRPGVMRGADPHAIRHSRWEVRERTAADDGELSGGSVLMQARVGPVPMDIVIDEPTIVRSYMAYFDECWENPKLTTTDPAEVRAELDLMRPSSSTVSLRASHDTIHLPAHDADGTAQSLPTEA